MYVRARARMIEREREMIHVDAAATCCFRESVWKADGHKISRGRQQLAGERFSGAREFPVEFFPAGL